MCIRDSFADSLRIAPWQVALETRPWNQIPGSSFTPSASRSVPDANHRRLNDPEVGLGLLSKTAAANVRIERKDSPDYGDDVLHSLPLRIAGRRGSSERRGSDYRNQNPIEGTFRSNSVHYDWNNFPHSDEADYFDRS